MPRAEKSEKLDKRTLILEAALEIFARKGVFATRIADIANEAGIAYGLVYHYFRNKEEILNTIFEERWALVTQLLEDADKNGTDTLDRLQRAATVFLHSYRERPRVVELLLLEFTRTSKFLEPVHIEQIARAFSVVTGIIERGQEAGELRSDVQARLLMLVFLGGLQLIIQAQLLDSFQPPTDFDQRGAESVVDVFMQGVVRR